MFVPSRRHRLLGATEPPDWTGPAARLFPGGHNYGYMLNPNHPRGVPAGAKPDDVYAYLWHTTVVGLSGVAMQLAGNLTINWREALWHLVGGLCVNETLGWWSIQNPVMDDWEDAYDQPYRHYTGSSFLANFLAGYAFYCWALRGTKLGWLPFIATSITLAVDFSWWWDDIDRKTQETSGVHHAGHLLGFGVGVLDAATLRFWPLRLSGRGLSIPGQFVLGLAWGFGNYVYHGLNMAELEKFRGFSDDD